MHRALVIYPEWLAWQQIEMTILAFWTWYWLDIAYVSLIV